MSFEYQNKTFANCNTSVWFRFPLLNLIELGMCNKTSLSANASGPAYGLKRLGC